MTKETQVVCNFNLNFRSAGNKSSPVLFIATKGTHVNILGPVNKSGYALGRIDTFRKGSEMQTVADSLEPSQPGATVEVKLGRDAVFIADKPVDEFGRILGHVEGWFYVAYTTPMEATG